MSGVVLKDLKGTSRFSLLMGLYGENFARITQLLNSLVPAQSLFCSEAGGGPALWVEVLEQHRFTTILRMTHEFADPKSGALSLDPCAYVRVYHDARMAEVTHCSIGEHLKTLFNARTPLNQITSHRQQMNVFFNKWLDFLLSGGHTRASMQLVHGTRETAALALIPARAAESQRALSVAKH
jgi:uncharacterized protein